MSRRDERGGIVIGWAVKLILVVAIFGLTLYEAGAIVIGKVQVDGIAIDAAREAGFAYGRSQKVSDARAAARALAERSGGTVTSLTLSRDRRTIRVTVRKRAPTIVAHRIGPLRRYTDLSASQAGRVR